MKKDEEFIYPGYMSSEAQEFFKGHYVEEQRDGCGAVGTFLKLSDGKTKMPSKGDIFIRNKKGISLKNEKIMKKNFIISVNNTEDVNNVAKKLRDLGCKIDTISSFSGIITGSTELLLKELEIDGVKHVEEEREVKEV